MIRAGVKNGKLYPHSVKTIWHATPAAARNPQSTTPTAYASPPTIPFYNIKSTRSLSYHFLAIFYKYSVKDSCNRQGSLKNARDFSPTLLVRLFMLLRPEGFFLSSELWLVFVGLQLVQPFGELNARDQKARWFSKVPVSRTSVC